MRRRFLVCAGILLAGQLLGACSPAAAAASLPASPASTPTASTVPATAAPAHTVEAAILSTATEEPTPTPVPTQPAAATAVPAGTYLSQPGDTFASIAGRFGLFPLDLRCHAQSEPFCPQTEAGAGFDAQLLLPAGTAILLPDGYQRPPAAVRLIPDSELIFSTAASDFDTAAALEAAGGFLADHRQYLMMNAWNTAAQVIDLVAAENSTNPRLLLALLEYQCGCVYGSPADPEPYLGAEFTLRHDLYGQLVWAVHELSNGYYGWRAGSFNRLTLADGTAVRLDPALNAGTVALYSLFSKLYGAGDFWRALDPQEGFPAVFTAMFGDPWALERVIYPDGIDQPALDLPFEAGFIWSYTGGPHPAFEGNGPFAALDFAPASAAPGCQPTPAWVVAVADGLVVRSEYSMVHQDLDGDGDERTGWVIVYLHISEETRVPVGTFLETGDRLGQPSCEGGTTNGTHLHIARLLNGEWIPAGSGPLPFNLGGWIASDGAEAYKGLLRRDGVTLEANTSSWRLSWIEND